MLLLFSPYSAFVATQPKMNTLGVSHVPCLLHKVPFQFIRISIIGNAAVSMHHQHSLTYGSSWGMLDVCTVPSGVICHTLLASWSSMVFGYHVKLS